MIKKIQKNKTCPAKLQRSRGFVILFALTLSAIILSIALGVANISLREIKFGTSAKDTNDAFFAADVGVECALFNNKSTSTIFVPVPVGPMRCLDNVVTVTGVSPFWSFILSGLGPQAQGCAKITVDKRVTLPSPITTIISNGYNNGGETSGFCTQGSNTIERQIELNY